MMDTSGEVGGQRREATDGSWVIEPFNMRWSDLSRFEQGYVEAMLRPKAETGVFIDAFRFTDLAPATLKTALADCRLGETLFAGAVTHPTFGAELWMRRQRGDFLQFPMTAERLRPLVVSLGEDGKVHAK